LPQAGGCAGGQDEDVEGHGLRGSWRVSIPDAIPIL
jgi:hypothetical protein